MVKKNFKYRWAFRDRQFELLNRRNKILKEIETMGFSSTRMLQFVNGFYVMTGVSDYMTQSNPLSGNGVVASPPNSDVL